MITESTTALNRGLPHPTKAMDPVTDPMTKPPRRIRVVDGVAKWRKARVIKVHFAIERYIEVGIGSCASSPRKKSKPCSQGHHAND
jgi:hypothetical protein